MKVIELRSRTLVCTYNFDQIRFQFLYYEITFLQDHNNRRATNTKYARNPPRAICWLISLFVVSKVKMKFYCWKFNDYRNYRGIVMEKLLHFIPVPCCGLSCCLDGKLVFPDSIKVGKYNDYEHLNI